jgi:hypothetical protein
LFYAGGHSKKECVLSKTAEAKQITALIDTLPFDEELSGAFIRT